MLFAEITVFGGSKTFLTAIGHPAWPLLSLSTKIFENFTDWKLNRNTTLCRSSALKLKLQGLDVVFVLKECTCPFVIAEKVLKMSFCIVFVEILNVWRPQLRLLFAQQSLQAELIFLWSDPFLNPLSLISCCLGDHMSMRLCSVLLSRTNANMKVFKFCPDDATKLSSAFELRTFR